MSLDEYKRKRRFEETPEPPPKVEKQSRHRFVVQRHAATRLHYDFRLEKEACLNRGRCRKGRRLIPRINGWLCRWRIILSGTSILKARS